MTRSQSILDNYLFKSTVGFDKLFNQFKEQIESSMADGYPPFNIIALSENEWLISIAVAGFSMENLTITLEKNILSIEGNPPVTEKVNYIHKGIAGRKFRREFTVAPHIEVVSATLELGVLNIHILRNVPEEMQPKLIPIITK